MKPKNYYRLGLMIKGLIDIAQGTVLFLSFGYINPYWVMRWALYCMSHHEKWARQ